MIFFSWIFQVGTLCWEERRRFGNKFKLSLGTVWVIVVRKGLNVLGPPVQWRSFKDSYKRDLLPWAGDCQKATGLQLTWRASGGTSNIPLFPFFLATHHKFPNISHSYSIAFKIRFCNLFSETWFNLRGLEPQENYDGDEVANSFSWGIPNNINPRAHCIDGRRAPINMHLLGIPKHINQGWLNMK